MTYLIFGIVAAILFGIASLTGFTYNTINIIVYYLLIPLSWAFMGDRILHLQVPWLTLSYAIVWVAIFIITAGHFRAWCDKVFQWSVDFLLWFRRIGWNYYVASVYICVWLPLLIYVALAGVLIWQHPGAWNWKPWATGIAAVFIVGWLAEFAIMKFGVKLQPERQRPYAYTLTAEEGRKIANETRGMSETEIADYAVKYAGQKLDFVFSNTNAMNRGEGNCINYAAVCTAAANHAFQSNGMNAKATHSVGTVKMLGIDMCKTISGWVGSGPMAAFFRDHDFVTFTTSSGTYHLDPSIKDIFGYDLKTRD